jgi:hypothetical protein
MRPMHLEDPLVRTSEVAARSDVDPTLQTDRPPEADGPTPGVPRVPGAPADSSAPGRFRWDLVAKVAVVGSLVLAVWLRFWTPSALWLDEALTVDIARAPLHQIPQLLRHDGAPPLYYYLLHFWMEVFGQSNLGTRSLAGVIGVINLPIAWLTGYRVGSRWWATESISPEDRRERDRKGRVTAWAVTLLVASSPFVVYYDTEARMYGPVIFLGTLTVLSYMYILRRPSLWNALGLAVITSALLYSHYWAFYSTAVAGIGTTWCAWKGPYQRPCRYALAGIVLACVSFVPWLPTFLYQAHHTGTPWAAPAELTVVVFTVTQFAGGNSDPGRALAVLFFFLTLLAICGLPLDRWRVVLDLRSRPGVRLLAISVLATIVLGVLTGRLTGSTFADRYTAMIVFPALVIMAYGLTAISDTRTRNGFLAIAVFLGFLAAIPNAFLSRTQAGQVGVAIEARATAHDIVAYCPDQLGPAVSRVLDGRYQEITFPRQTPPEIVDWVNYLNVVRGTPPGPFVTKVEAMAGSTGSVFYVWAPGYTGFAFKCQQIADALARWPRHHQTVVVKALGSDTPFEIYEGETLDRFAPN